MSYLTSRCLPSYCDSVSLRFPITLGFAFLTVCDVTLILYDEAQTFHGGNKRDRQRGNRKAHHDKNWKYVTRKTRTHPKLQAKGTLFQQG